MEFRILGVLEALDDGLPVSLGGPKQRSVLAMLLLEPNRVVATDRLVDGLWGDDPPLRAAATLQVYVSNLRKALEPDRGPRAEPSLLLTQPPGYRLAVEPEQIDLFRFERMVGVARALAADGCAVGAAVLLREALTLWRETPLADLANERFAIFEVTRLDEARIGAIEDRLDADLVLGRDIDLLPELEALVARHPYRERLRRQLMLALYRSGRQVDALAAYQAARDVLVEELGLEPGRELREVEAAILVQDPELSPAGPVPLAAPDVERVLRAANRVEPERSVVDAIVEESRRSARRGEDALRGAIDTDRTRRLSVSLATADATQTALVRARRDAADRVLERRHRRESGIGSARREARPSRTEAAADVCPYKGLLRFEPEDAAWYFGRERLVADLLATVASTRCTGIVGASGSGKSSLTRAGLLAALADDALPGSAHWPRVLVHPGADPVMALARALAPAAHAVSADHVRDRLLDEPESVAGFTARAVGEANGDASLTIVVDQLEEVFTVCGDDSLRTRFLDVLVHAASDDAAGARVVAAVRSDYYARCAEHADFAELLGRTNVLVGPMRPDELQRAIEEPARRAGLVLEHGLLERIFEDVGTEPGSLPLLETALLETWARRSDHTLTIEGYEASGGVRGAVAHLADNVYDRLSQSERGVARGIFLRLAEPGVGTDDVRRRAPLDELIVDDEHAAVLATLVDHRLVVTADETAEVAHEALLREWPRLRRWLEEDREGRRVHRTLSNGAQEWAANVHDDDLLFRGSRLAAALDVADAHPAEINPVEREFLAASRTRQETDLRDAHRTANRFRRLTVALAALLVVAIVASVVTLLERSRADDNAARAARQATAARATSLATLARSGVDEHLDLALLLAVEARRLHPSVDTDAALETALQALPGGVQRAFALDPRGRPYPTISNDGKLVAVAGDDGFVRLFDSVSGRLVRRLDGPFIDNLVAPLFSNDGSLLAVGSGAGRVTVWEVASGHRLGRPLVAHGTGAAYGFFDPTDRHRIVTVANDGTVTRWVVGGPEPQREVLFETRRSGAPLTPLVFSLSGDGRRLLVGDANDGPTSLWDLDGRTEVCEVPGLPGLFGPGGTFVTTIPPSRVVVWDPATCEPATTVNVTDAGFLANRSPDGKLIALSDGTSAVRVLDASTGMDVIPPVRLHTIQPIIRFLADGRLFTASSDRIAILRLDTQVRSLGTVLGRNHASVTRAMFTGDGRRIVTVDAVDGERVWSAANGTAAAAPADPAELTSTAVASPDLRKAVVAGADGTLVLTGRHGPGAALPVRDRLFDVTFSPDSSRLAVAFAGSTDLYRVDDVAHPHLVARLHPFGTTEDTPPWRTSVAFSPDSRLVVVAREHSGTATTFDARSGHRLYGIAGRNGQTISAVTFSQDGRTLAAAVGDTFRTTRGLVEFVEAATGTVRGRLSLPYYPRGVAFVNGGRRVVTLRGGTDPGAATASASSLDIWDIATQRTVGGPLAFPAGATTLTASPDGRRVVHGTDAGFAVAWDVDPGHWSTLACRIAGRKLTHAEWRHYLPGRPYDPVCRA
jgi:DNA-binding SARP family transcriptional activator/WD40 repeat protein